MSNLVTIRSKNHEVQLHRSCFGFLKGDNLFELTGEETDEDPETMSIQYIVESNDYQSVCNFAYHAVRLLRGMTYKIYAIPSVVTRRDCVFSGIYLFTFTQDLEEVPMREAVNNLRFVRYPSVSYHYASWLKERSLDKISLLLSLPMWGRDGLYFAHTVDDAITPAPAAYFVADMKKLYKDMFKEKGKTNTAMMTNRQYLPHSHDRNPLIAAVRGDKVERVSHPIGKLSMRDLFRRYELEEHRDNLDRLISRVNTDSEILNYIKGVAE